MTPSQTTQLPLVWVLLGQKAGDNNQVLALAEQLPWPFQCKQFNYRPFEILSNRLLGVTLAGLDRQRSSDLSAPWPDLVITAGRRNEPVARWIKRQSGGKTRLVHMGRPWAPLAVFDLLVTTPQYFLPQQENILHNQLPLHRADEEKINQSVKDWQQQLEAFPRPYIAVLLGGNSGPYTFSPASAKKMGQLVNQLAHRQQASLLISSSARTSGSAYHAFEREIDVPSFFYRWHRDDTRNPYLAYLGLADSFVVTGESMSMLTETAATGKPLYIYNFADRPLPWWCYWSSYRFNALVHRLAMWIGPKRMRRDIGNIQRSLLSSGRAALLGQEVKEKTRDSSQDDMARTVERVCQLLG
jgi:mitochondrial fission protein ELM1